MRESNGVSLGRRVLRTDLRLGELCCRLGCMLDKTSMDRVDPTRLTRSPNFIMECAISVGPAS